MGELCLMASHGYPLGFHSDHVSNRLSEDFHHFLPFHGSNQDMFNPLSFNLSLQQKEELRSNGGLLDSNNFIRIDSTCKKPTLIDFQDSHPDSALLSYGIAERCTRHEKILKLLSFGSIEEQGHLLDLSMLYDLVGPQSPNADLPKQPFGSCSTWCFTDDAQPLQNLVHPTTELYFNEPFLSQLPYHRAGTEMNDVLSVISDLYSSKMTNKSSRQTMLVPYFERRRRAQTNTNASKLATETASHVKSPDKTKEKASQKKKTNARTVKERDIYCNSSLHACESLLSIIVGRKQQGKNAILSLKKSGPQLPHLLTQVSASIAGTGIAVILSVLCRVACSRVPFCSSRVLSTGLGLGLVWLSWGVNKLRDTVVSICKSSGKFGEKEEEMMNCLDGNLKDIYFRVAALMAVMVLKVA